MAVTSRVPATTEGGSARRAHHPNGRHAPRVRDRAAIAHTTVAGPRARCTARLPLGTWKAQSRVTRQTRARHEARRDGPCLTAPARQSRPYRRARDSAGRTSAEHAHIVGAQNARPEHSRDRRGDPPRTAPLRSPHLATNAAPSSTECPLWRSYAAGLATSDYRTAAPKNMAPTSPPSFSATTAISAHSTSSSRCVIWSSKRPASTRASSRSFSSTS